MTSAGSRTGLQRTEFIPKKRSNKCRFQAQRTTNIHTTAATPTTAMSSGSTGRRSKSSDRLGTNAINSTPTRTAVAAEFVAARPEPTRRLDEDHQQQPTHRKEVGEQCLCPRQRVFQRRVDLLYGNRAVSDQIEDRKDVTDEEQQPDQRDGKTGRDGKAGEPSERAAMRRAPRPRPRSERDRRHPGR